MKKATVSIQKADGYEYNEVRSAIEKGINLIGGLEPIIQPGNKVFVKINHLPPASTPEKAIVTHPIFVEAVIEILKTAGADISVGDDIESLPDDGFHISGIQDACTRAGVKLINLREAGFVNMEFNGIILKEVYISKTALEADVIVNLPKLKTHSLTTFTGSIKNMYGTIPVGLRTQFHGEYINRKDFAQVLVDIFSAVKPHLTIMDGIVAMEGDGPALGNPRKLGITLVSQDAVALDAVATRVIGLKPNDIDTTRLAGERGLGAGNLRNLDIVGESIDEVAVSDFKLPMSVAGILTEWIPPFLSNFIMNQISSKPIIKEKLCTACSVCVNACPVNAIQTDGEVFSIVSDICIKCMCCHEVCRFSAVVPKRTLVGTMIVNTGRIIKKLAFGSTGKRLD